MIQATAARRAAYEPLGPAARIAPAWAQPFILLLMFAGGAAAMVFATLGVGALAAVNGRFVSPVLFESWWAGLSLTLVLFAVWAVLAVAWVRKVERRRLATAGLPSPRRGDAAWWIGGALWSLILVAVLTAVAGPELGDAPIEQAAFTAGGALLVIACSVAAVAVLATAEEVVFRGWALSAMSARVGRGWALAGTSVLFGAAHVFPTEWADPARLLSFLGFAAMGVAFGAVALSQGGVWSSSAFHAGYNSVLVLLSAWSTGFDPQGMWSGAAGGRSGFDSVSSALALALTQGALAVAAVLFWRAGGQARLRFLSRPRSSSSAR